MGRVTAAFPSRVHNDMPGIAGMIGAGPPEERSCALARMMLCMKQDAFCTGGSLSNQDLGLWIGWIRREGSSSHCLPWWNETKDICMVFIGENFPEQSDIARLRSRGHRFRSEDASYLVHVYEEKGLDFLRDINAWFCGVLIDLRKSKAVLFNDRYGLSRIYYHEREDTFYFSSEAKSLLKILPDLRKLDLSSLGEFFSCGCALCNKSLFRGISILPGGSRWEFTPGRRMKKAVYFAKEEWENQPLLSKERYYETLKSSFAQILPRYLPEDQSVGVSLTGGLDSRMIMAWAPSVAGRLPCYAFGSAYRDSADVRLARLVAKTCQQPYQIIRVGSEFLSQFPALAEETVYASDGAMDVSGSVELYVNRLARHIAPIRLTGNYGSEVLRGNVAFKPISLHEPLFHPDFIPRIHEAADSYASEAKDRRQSFILFKQVPWHHYARLSVEQSQLTVRTPYLDNNLARLAYQAPEDPAASAGVCMRLVADGNPALTRFGTDRAVGWHPKPVLSKAQNLYQELTARAEYAFDYGMPQWLSRMDSLFTSLHWERLFLGRHKFYHFRVWYRDDLSTFLKDVLLDSRTRARPYLCGRSLERLVTNHLEGYRNYTLEFHRVLTAELIERLLIEQI
jgi:asparagine synthase (glutamine-hydrolysing)